MSKTVHYIWNERILGIIHCCIISFLLCAVTGFPSPDVIEGLANKLNSTYRGNYLVFNLSGVQYDTELFENQVRSMLCRFVFTLV